MNKLNLNNHVLALGLITSFLVISGCNGSSSNPVNKTYRVTLNNITANQPMSPVAMILHKPGYQLWQPGQAASIALEGLAEGGDATQVLAEAGGHADFIASKAGTGAIPPSGSETLELSAGDMSGFNITVATMLVNTNDAFVGVSSNKIAGLAKGESFAMHVPIWDAGTESNSEAAGTMPGLADGGEGFNTSRAGDSDFVAIHQGVVTHDDGLSTSVLGESHRFNNPGALLRVERVE